MTRPPLLLHPVTLVSLAVLVLNDHWFKQAHAGQLSWVCSDIAGLALVPLLLSGVMAELRRGRDCSTSFALCAGLVVAAAFAAVKLSAAANAIAAPILGGPTVRDPFDLLALPAVLTAFVVLTARARSCSPHKVANSRVPPPSRSRGRPWPRAPEPGKGDTRRRRQYHRGRATMRKRIIIATILLSVLAIAAAIGFYLFGAVGLLLGIGCAVVAVFGSSEVYREIYAKNALWESGVHRRSGQDFRGRFKQ